MLKKLTLLGLLVLIPTMTFGYSVYDAQIKEAKKNVQYSPIQKHERDYQEFEEYSFKPVENVYDPKLIELTSFTPISDKDFDAKMAKDEKTYSTKIATKFKRKTNADGEADGVDYYNIYRIAERLIRANNLDFVNWRIAIRKTIDVNASTYQGYYIIINTGLYDAIYKNEDAMAFILAHEMTHQLMGHNQRKQDMALSESSYRSDIKKSNRSEADCIVGLVSLFQLKGLYSQSRMMELVADAGGLELLLRAGYSPYKAKEALNYIDGLATEKRYAYASHPVGEDRLINYDDTLYTADPNWVGVGRENLYNSQVLTCKKSSDHVSFIIDKSEKAKTFYHVETPLEKIQRIAYVAYLKGNMKIASKYFKKLTEIDENSYIPYVYLSYSLDYMSNETGKAGMKKAAKKAIKRAYELNSKDPEVLKKYKELGVE
jgi:Zn-dependent protease with chaperone function